MKVETPGADGFCRHLRSKKSYFQPSPTRAEDFRDASNHYWCFVTMQVVGPEGALVCPESCQSRRLCFESSAGLAQQSGDAQLGTGQL